MKKSDVAHYARKADALSDHDVRGAYKGRLSKSYPIEITSLRAYRHWHPAARVHLVTHRGRDVWMTDKQYDIWSFIQASHWRHKRITLKTVAAAGGCSRATASRFLRKLDLWRFVDIATFTGRLGGVFIYTRKATSRERDAWMAGARHTWASRAIARRLLADRIRKRLRWDADRRWAERARERIPRPPPPVGSTDATFMSIWDS